MNKEKFKELRSQINIPLAEAMNLLKQHDENLELCIKVFHQKNIEKICTETGLDEVQVQKIYKELSHLYDVDRIILGIVKKQDTLNSLPMRITIEENPDYIQKIGFFISVENEQLEEIYNVHDQVYFIPEFEFSHVIDVFRSVLSCIKSYD